MMTGINDEIEYSRAIKNLADEDKPREKAQTKGFASLSTAELLAILIGSGSPGESVVDLCQRILNNADNKLYNIARCSIKDLVRQYKGIGEVKAIEILAALELARRYREEDFAELPQITESRVAFEYIRWDLSHLSHEEFWIITLNRAKRVTGKYKISHGGTSQTVVDAKIVMKTAIEHLADGIIVVHNHPSGNMKPSGEDDRITNKLREGCKFLDIEMVDHIIVSQNGYYSYIDNGR